MRTLIYRGQKIKMLEFDGNDFPVEVYINDEYIEPAFDYEMGEIIAKQWVDKVL